MVRYSDLTDRDAVMRAIAECNALGRDEFLAKHGFSEEANRVLLVDDGEYDSNAVFGVAWRQQHGTSLRSDEFSGGSSGAAGQLSALGFVITWVESERSATEYDSVAAAMVDSQSLSKTSPPYENSSRLVSSREFTSQKASRT